MILDSLNEFCDNTAINTGGAGSYVVGNVIDMLETAPKYASDCLYLVITVMTSLASATGTCNLQLASAATSDLTSSPTIHWQTGALAQAALVAGTQWVVEVPRGAYKEYLGILQTTATAAFTAGKIDAYLTNDPAAHNILPAPNQA